MRFDDQTCERIARGARAARYKVEQDRRREEQGEIIALLVGIILVAASPWIMRLYAIGVCWLYVQLH